MAFDTIRNTINTQIRTNDNEDITGNILNDVLDGIVDAAEQADSDLAVPALRTRVAALENNPSSGVTETQANNLIRSALSSGSQNLPAIPDATLTITESGSAQLPGATAPTIRATQENLTVVLPSGLSSTNDNFVSLNIHVENLGGQGNQAGWVRVRQGSTDLVIRQFDTYHNSNTEVYFQLLNTSNLTIQYFLQGFFDLTDNVNTRRYSTTGTVSTQGVLFPTASRIIEAGDDAVRGELSPQLAALQRADQATRTEVAANTALRNLFTTETITQNVPASFLVNDTIIADDATYNVPTSGTLLVGFTAAQSHAGFRIMRQRGSQTDILTPDVVRSDPQYFYGEIQVLANDELTGITMFSFPTTRLHQRVGRLEAQTSGVEDIIHSDSLRLLENATVTDIDGNTSFDPTAYNISLSSNDNPFAQEFNEIGSNNQFFIVNPLTTPADGGIVLSLNNQTLLRRNGNNINALIRVPATEATTRTETVYLATNTEAVNHRLNFGDPSRFTAERNEIALILPDELVSDRQITFNWRLFVQGNEAGSGQFVTGWVGTRFDTPRATLNIGAGNVVLSVESRTQGGERDFNLRATPSQSGGGVGAVISNSYITFTASYTATRNVPAAAETSREVLFQRVGDPLVIGIDGRSSTWRLISNFSTIDTDYPITNLLSTLAVLGGGSGFDVYPVTPGQVITSASIVSLEAHKNVANLGLFTTVTGADQTTLSIPARVIPNTPTTFLDTFDTSRTTDREQSSRTLTASQLRGVTMLYIKFASNRSDGNDRHDDAWIDLRFFRERVRSEDFGTNDSAVRLNVQSRLTGGNLSSITLSGIGSGIVIKVIRGY